MTTAKTTVVPRLLEKYRKEIVPAMMEKFGIKNIWRVPKLEKIVINMGVGEAAHEVKIVEEAARDLALITGQKPVITKARKSIAGFKIRKGNPVGCKVTLRGTRMYEFLDRFISVAVPRIRDFRGFPRTSFDGQGNYSFGIEEQTIFPEVDLDKITRTQGMDITIVTTAPNDKEAEYLLELFGFPFTR